MEDDDRLLRRCREGDERALEELIRRYQDRVFRLAHRASGDAALAEEAAAEVFVKLWSKSRSWRGQSSAGTWIYRVAVRTVLDARRAQRRWWRRVWSAAPRDETDTGPGPEEAAEGEEEAAHRARRLDAALDGLNEADRVLVHLYYFEDRSLAEIEEIMGVRRETLKTRLARARDRLRKKLEEDDHVE